MADQSTATCSACGYSLRGLASDHCPECGEPIRWRKLVFLDRGQFESAERALRATGIAFQSFDSDRGLGNIIGIETGMMDRKHILIDRTRFDEAMEMFERHDIHFPLPLVDRSEPQCPNCGITFDLSVESQCPSCRAGFSWIDVDDADFDRDDLKCESCGYWLRGSVGPSCPECGASAPREWSEVHSTDDPSKRPSARVATSSWWHHTPRRIGRIILLIIVITVVWSVIRVALSIDSLSSGVALLLGIVIFAAIIAATSWRRSSSRPPYTDSHGGGFIQPE